MRMAPVPLPTAPAPARRAQLWPQRLPLAPAPIVQRRVELGPAPEQRAAEVGIEEAAAPEATDLNKLARDILPLLKRMLSIERERRSGRW